MLTKSTGYDVRRRCLIAKPHDKLQHDVQSYNHKVGPPRLCEPFGCGSRSRQQQQSSHYKVVPCRLFATTFIVWGIKAALCSTRQRQWRGAVLLTELTYHHEQQQWMKKDILSDSIPHFWNMASKRYLSFQVPFLKAKADSEMEKHLKVTLQWKKKLIDYARK